MGGYGEGLGGPQNPPPRIRVKQARFGKLAFLQQNGALFGPKKRDFRPFRATFSVKKFGPLLCDFWSIGTFGSVRCVLHCSTKTRVLGMIAFIIHQIPLKT